MELAISAMDRFTRAICIYGIFDGLDLYWVAAVIDRRQPGRREEIRGVDTARYAGG